MLVFTPKDEEAAARFLSRCARLAGEGRDVSVRIAASAAGSDLEGRRRIGGAEALEGAGPGGIDALVLTEGLSGIREISAADMLVRAGGGAPLADVAAVAEEHGLWFPHHDAEVTAGMSVARLLMEAPALPVSHAYGGLREYVLALRLVTGAGQEVRFGSRAVKDVAGYEMIGLILGGGGRYGVITEATLRLIPKPAELPEYIDLPAQSAGPADGPLDQLTEKVRRVFDPAGILR